MSTRRGCYGVMLAAVVAIAACTDGEDEPTPTIPTPSESTASLTSTVTTDAAPSTTTRTPSPAEQDEAEAIATLKSFNAALDAASRGEESIEVIYPWAVGTAREQWATQYLVYREQGWTITGDTTVEVTDIDVEGDQASIVACADVSQVEVVDENGESVLADDRLPQTLNDYVLERSQSAEFGWLVVEDVNRDEPCEG